MRKFLFIALFSFFALGTFAAPVYDVEQIWYTNEQNQGRGQGSYYLLKFKADSDVYLTDYINNIFSGDQTETLSNMGITQYGYYLNGDKTDNHATNLGDNVKSFDGYDYNAGTAHYNRNAYYLGNFKAGDTAEIWMTDGTTEVSSYTPINGAYTSRYMARQDKINPGMPVAQLFMYNSTGYEVNFGLYTMVGEPVITDTTVSGSPLPTPIVTLLIALAVAGVAYTYKKKQLNA